MAKRKRETPQNGRPGPLPEPPPAPRIAPSQTSLDQMGRWYLDCFDRLSEHLGRHPSIQELATWIRRTTTPVHRKLSQLEGLGFLRRNARGGFERTGKIT